jgi:hypothetical protein
MAHAGVGGAMCKSYRSVDIHGKVLIRLASLNTDGSMSACSEMHNRVHSI